jgi:hypothetical protein
VILGVQKERFTTRPVFISSVGSESDRSFPERSTEHDMDEPFGALDFLTRLKMRADLVRIWQSEKKTILFVTHDIEEAIQLADRVLVMSPRPAMIQEVIDVALPRPRDLDSPGYLEKRDRIFRVMGMSLRVGEAAAA